MGLCIVHRIELQWYVTVTVVGVVAVSNFIKICLVSRQHSICHHNCSIIQRRQSDRETINSANEWVETVAWNKTVQEKAMLSTANTTTQQSSFNNSIKSKYNLLISFPYLPVVLWEGNGWESFVLRRLLLQISQLDHIHLRNNFINAFIQFR